ncbi:MAG: C45 family autoproteolytic acyltransferase/hydrolase [Candidatus Rokuibacteriota bacterium]
MSTSILPFIHAQGSWGEIGHQVGRMFAPSIERHLEVWTRHVMRETRCAREAVEEAAAPFAEPIREHAPFLWEELEGMARGSGLPVSRLLILQARAEVMRANRAAVPSLECTTFGLTGRRTAGEVTLFGQNVDLVPFVEEFGVIVRQYPRGAPAVLLYTTAGLLGHNGLNEAGVGVCANFIDDPGGWGVGLPRYLLSRLALRAESAEAAREAALTPPRAASRNLLIADDRGVLLDLEALRREAAILRASDGLLVHANHLEAPEFQGYEKASENSRVRRERLEQLLAEAPGPLTIADIQGFYRDHANAPHSLCAHPFPGRNLQTVVSVIGDLTNRELHAAKGSPCQAPYATYTLATCQSGALSVTVRGE